MPTDQHSHGGRRPHFHRGRRGPDRRSGDRRPQLQQSQGPGGQGPTESNRADTINVDQIVRDIKARIAQRHGIDLSSSQIQELASRRLEAILDPRTLKPSLLDQLRQAAGTPAAIAPVEPPAAYEFQDHTIFDTHNGLLRVVRSLLKPILKLFFNPNPIAHALNAQARLNKDAAARELERERTQAEWNALHYTLVQRLVTELARTSIETQSLTLRIESLSTRVDYYERRVRELEQGAQPANTAQSTSGLSFSPGRPTSGEGGSAGGSGVGGGDSESSRRRRRRRRGRRGPGGPDGGADQSLDTASAEMADEGGRDEMEAEAAPADPRPPDTRPAEAATAAAPDTSAGGPTEES
jgi:hypothetical protein